MSTWRCEPRSSFAVLKLRHLGMHDCENERVRGILLLIDWLRFGETGMVKRFAVFGLSRLIPNSWQSGKTQP